VVGADDERLRDALRLGLLGVLDVQAQAGTVAQQLPELRQGGRSGDDQNFPDVREHQNGQGIIDHRFVADGQQLFRHRQGYRVKSCSAAAREDNPLHCTPPEWNGRMLAAPSIASQGGYWRR
jgi:hypothetical protein